MTYMQTIYQVLVLIFGGWSIISLIMLASVGVQHIQTIERNSVRGIVRGMVLSAWVCVVLSGVGLVWILREIGKF